MQTALDTKRVALHYGGTMKTEPLQNRRQKGRQNMTAQTATATGDDLLTLDELAERLKMHPVTVRGLKRRGVIPALKLGHRTLRFEYAKVLDALRQAGDPAADQAEN
jgi:excisionase family DNA binding protein